MADAPAAALRCAAPHCALPWIVLLPQVTKYVEREIINHRQLVHPHIVQFKEVHCRRGHTAPGTCKGLGRWG